MAQKFITLNQKILKFLHIHCAQETYQNIGQWIRKKTGLKGYVYGFSTDYNYIPVSNILDIHKYLMEKNKMAVRV